MKYLIIISILCFWGSNVCAQSDLGSTENAVMIGDIDMNTVIIHVYKNKTDQWPYKEFSIVEDENSGEKKVISSSIKGKISKGGFIIVNGLKSMHEIQRLVSGQKVYDEIVVKDVPKFEEYETIISDYLKESILEDAKINELPNPDSSVEIENPSSEVILETDTSTEEFVAIEDMVENETEEEEVKEVSKETNKIKEKSKSSIKSSHQKKKSFSPYKAVKYKSKYGQKKSRKMASRTRPKKNKKNHCYKF